MGRGRGGSEGFGRGEEGRLGRLGFYGRYTIKHSLWTIDTKEDEEMTMNSVQEPKIVEELRTKAARI